MKKIIKYLVVGFVLGIVLTKSEAVSWYRIYEMFQFQSFHMYGIISVAILTGLIGIQLIKRRISYNILAYEQIKEIVVADYSELLNLIYQKD